MSEQTDNYRETTPTPSSPRRGTGPPPDPETTTPTSRIIDPSLLIPSIPEERIHRAPTSPNTSTTSPLRNHHRYDASHMDYRIAQAWISSATPTATPVVQTEDHEHSNTHTINIHNNNDNLHTNIHNINSNNNNNNSHRGDQGSLEDFEDEFAESVQGQNRSNNVHGSPIRNSFEEIRRNLFSRSSAGVQQEDGDREAPNEDSNEVKLSWRGENPHHHHHHYHHPEATGQHHIVEDGGDASIPSTPPSIPHDLMDLSSNNNENHTIDEDNENDARRVDDDKDSSSSSNNNPNVDVNTSSSFKAVARPGEIAHESPFEWMRNPQGWIPDEIVLDDDQRANMEDEVLTGDADESLLKEDSNPRLFRPPTLGRISRPTPIRSQDREITPQSWHTPISMLPTRGIAYRNTSGGTSSAPLSPGSRRSAKSEKYYHSYETNPATPPKPVPPFVVVHSGGSAVVTVTPKRTTLVVVPTSPSNHGRNQGPASLDFHPFYASEAENEAANERNEVKCGCDGDDTKAKAWCRTWGRPVMIALTSAVFVLAIITVVTSLVASRFQNKPPQQQQPQQLRPRVPTASPVVLSPTIVPDLITTTNNNTTDPWEGVVMRPYEETQNPAEVRPTLPPRTFPPSPAYAEIPIPTSAPTMLPENFPAFVPTSLPFFLHPTQEPFSNSNNEEVELEQTSLQIPWNNYVIGLLSVESPNTFAAFDDATSPQFLALQWISIDTSRKGGSIAYDMDASLQRFALATVYFALGGLDGSWIDDDSWLSTVVPVCEWKGITCDENNIAVLTLDLASNGLSGSLPEELKLLKYLQVLNFPQNSIGGSLPPEYSDLYELVELNLSGNDLTGSIPEEYGGYGSFEILEILDVSENNLQGRLPSQLGNLVNLEAIRLNSNTMTGTIPSSLGSLTELKILELDNNEFTGDVPVAVCDLDPSAVWVDCTVGCECCDAC